MSATVNLKLWKYRPKKDGTFPIYIRITKNRKSSWLSTDISVLEKDWNEDKGKVKPSHPNSARINALLKQTEVKYHSEVLKAEDHNLELGVKGIKHKIVGKDVSVFPIAAKELLENYKAQGNIGTYDKCKTIVKKLTDYMHSENYTFQDLDIRHLSNYRQFLLKDCNNKNSTVNSNLKFIKTVFLYAQKMEYIPLTLNPFIKITKLKEDGERGFLTDKEIQSIEELDLSEMPELNKAKAITLFQYYSGGLRISDVLLLKKENIINDRLYITIKKTGKQTSHKLTSKALNLLNALKETGHSYIFGYLPNNLDEKDAVELDRQLSIRTALINRSLKKLGTLAEIKKKLTTHIFRHSFATNALQQGMSLDVLQRVLKHSNVRETQIYAKVLDQKIDTEIDKLKL